MPYVIVDAVEDRRGGILAASAEFPSDDECYASRNRVHAFDGKRWRVVAQWTGWQVTSIAAGADFAVCASIKGDLHFIRNGTVTPARHSEPERPIHCQLSTDTRILFGGSAGYYLKIDPKSGAISSHNLRHLDIDKPGRDIFAIHQLGADILFCGANRLLVRVAGSKATALVAAGPTAGTPNLVGAGMLGDTLCASSHGEMWRVEDNQLIAIHVPPEAKAETAFLAPYPTGLLTGSQALVSLTPRLEHTVLYRNPVRHAYVAAFTRYKSLPVAVFSNGATLIVSGAATPLPRIPRARAA